MRVWIVPYSQAHHNRCATFNSALSLSFLGYRQKEHRAVTINITPYGLLWVSLLFHTWTTSQLLPQEAPRKKKSAFHPPPPPRTNVVR